MIVEFKVKNFRSIKDEQSLSLVASSDTSLPENTFPAGKLRLVKAAGLYGANASGKSNIVKAIFTMRQMVLDSADTNSTVKSLIFPFRLDEKCTHQPSGFELTFYLDAIRYQYGFTATSEKVFEEWLTAYPKGYAQTWYRRSINPDTGETKWDWGRALKGDKTGLATKTRPDTLFLSAAKQWNHESLSKIHEWFRLKLRAISRQDYRDNLGSFTEYLFLNAPEEGKEYVREAIVTLLRSADLGIGDIRIRQRKVDEIPGLDTLPSDLKDPLIKYIEGSSHYAVEFLHKLPNRDTFVTFPSEEESSGTMQFFKFIGPWLDTIASGITVFVDELECNLHPLLTRQLIEVIQKSGRAGDEAQLVFTTHDTTQLDPGLLRRDQIWFTEKDEYGGTHLYPLTEYKPRKGEAIQKGYLSGRYGAVPVLQAFGEL